MNQPGQDNWLNKNLFKKLRSFSKTNFFILLLIIFLSFLLNTTNPNLWKHEENPNVLSQSTNNQNETIHTSCPYTTAEFPPRLNKNSGKLSNATAVNISHHLLASNIIADTLAKITPDYSTVIIIGPNHRGIGSYEAVTSYANWSTPFGKIKPDYKLLNLLSQSGAVHINEDIFSVEHSVCALTSFVKEYFPNATIVPIVLNANTSDKTSQIIASALAQNCKDCLLITSTDFSHEVSAKVAKQNDSTTANILLNLELENIDKTISDSKPTLKTLLYYLKDKSVTKGNLIHSTNSNEVSNQKLPTVTSYLTIIY